MFTAEPIRKPINSLFRVRLDSEWLSHEAIMNCPGRRRRLAFLLLHGLDHFAHDLIVRLPDVAGWDVRPFYVARRSDLDSALAWTDQPDTDALWFEFCWPPFPALVRALDFAGRRIVVRVHRIEATETPHVANMSWEKVDDVIVVSPDMEARVLAAAPEIAVTSRLSLVCNGVDTERFTHSMDWNPFRIGWCGLLTLRKNPTLALQVLARLHAMDPRYHLSMCGMGGESLAQETFVHLAKRLGLLGAIRWENNIPQARMPAWHAANGILLHTSLHEGLSYAVLEAAASGCDLAVLDHPGAAACWPERILFGSVDEAVDLVRGAQPGRWREHVCERYSLDGQIKAVSEILNNRPTRQACSV
ncbi:MAG TPA: glycosyltransferase family 4 protein [Acetobacteraceae bacterium]